MENEDLVFELNYLFEERKDIFQSLEKVENIYKTLYEFDKLVLRNIYPDASVEYSLIDLEYSSFKSKIEQLVKSIPDDLLKKPDLKTLIGLGLIKLKYALLKKLSSDKEITTVEQITEIAKTVNTEIGKIGKETKSITTEVSNHSILDIVSELSDKTNSLKEKEAYEYKSKFGNAILRKGTYVNKPKILVELGQKTETSKSTVLIKPKKIDLLSDVSSWNCYLGGKPIVVRISDKGWLDQFHKAVVTIEPGDLLRVVLVSTYNYDPVKIKTKVLYEVTSVVEVVKPQSNNAQTLL